jgi:hypothetical protein
LLNGDGSRPDGLREGHGIEKSNQIDLQILLDTEMMRNLDIGLVIISVAIAIDYPASVTREVCFRRASVESTERGEYDSCTKKGAHRLGLFGSFSVRLFIMFTQTRDAKLFSVNTCC